VISRTTFLLAIASGVAIVGNWLLLFASYSRASIAIGTAVYNVQPFMLVGLAALFLARKITLAKVTWLGVAFLGMLAIVSAHGAGQGVARTICWALPWRWGRRFCMQSRR
jgi:drug/metabolite transporter (DMT)-like permease